MPVPQFLHRKLQDILGHEAAEEVRTKLSAMEVNRGDISDVPGDLNELRHEMQLGFARVDARFEKFEAKLEKFDQKFDQKFATVHAQLIGSEGKMVGLFEKGLQEQTRFFLAWSVLLAAIVGLYAR